jgi:hypothetical protein
MSPRPTGNPAGDIPIPAGQVSPGEENFPHGDGAAQAPALTPILTLALEDLIPDARNEVVILDHSGREISVSTGEPVTAQGIETEHVTASGFDVSGFAYCTFESGLTLYYPPTHHLLIDGENPV